MIKRNWRAPRLLLVLSIAAALLTLAGCGPRETTAAPADPAYLAEIEQWRDTREEGLRSEEGWLSLVGLHWLEPGENTIGSDPDAHVVFPEGTAPARAGSLFVDDEGVRVVAVEGAGLSLDGAPVTERRLATDTAEDGPDVLRLGDLRFYVLERAGRYGLRVKNPNSPLRLNFGGMDYFPIDARYRVEASWRPYDRPREVEIATVIDTTETKQAPGLAEFTLNGEKLALEPVQAGERLWFIFRDGTSGKETYGAGRYLYSDAPQDGTVIVDFNKAYNPPCVFTPYATCPLPPRKNWLSVRVEAGEKVWSAHP